MNELPDQRYARWSPNEGYLLCKAQSTTQRLLLGADAAYPQPRAAEPMTSKEATLLASEYEFKRAAPYGDVRSYVERRVLYRLIDACIQEHVWPTNPQISWYDWDEYLYDWRPILWSPQGIR